MNYFDWGGIVRQGAEGQFLDKEVVERLGHAQEPGADASETGTFILTLPPFATSRRRRQMVETRRHLAIGDPALGGQMGQVGRTARWIGLR